MAYIVGSIPYFRCYVRREYTTNLRRYHGEFIPAVAYGVRCLRGHTLWFQCMLMEPEDGQPNATGGASFMVPLEAVCWKPCPMPADYTYILHYDIFSPDFGVCEFDFVKRGAVFVLPDRVPGQYRFSLDFTGTDLADDWGQHKHAHVCFLESGLVGAFPNNRLLWKDDAFWKMMDQKPDFDALEQEFRAEGNQHLIRRSTMPGPAAPVAEYVGEKKPAKKKPAAKKPAKKPVKKR